MSRLIIAICEDYIVINTHYDFAISISSVFLIAGQ